MNLDGIVSLFFAAVEVVLFVNVMIFAERTPLNKKAAALILLLFGYQFLEFLICYAGLISNLWIYLALTDITFLPPLGLIIILELDGRNRAWAKLIYLPAVFFSVYYLFNLSELSVTLCTIFTAGYSYPLSFLYGLFYYLPIAAGIYFLSLSVISQKEKKQKKLAGVLLTGYILSFIPPALISLLLPDVIRIIESFLCKFAIFLAIATAYFAIANKNIQPKGD